MKIINHTGEYMRIYVGEIINDVLVSKEVLLLKHDDTFTFEDKPNRVYVIDKDKDIRGDVNVKPIPS